MSQQNKNININNTEGQKKSPQKIGLVGFDCGSFISYGWRGDL